MLAVYLFRATSGAHHQEGLVMTLTASSSSRAVTNSPVVVALDYHNRDDALSFVDKIEPRDCRLQKIMLMLFFVFSSTEDLKALERTGEPLIKFFKLSERSTLPLKNTFLNVF